MPIPSRTTTISLKIRLICCARRRGKAAAYRAFLESMEAPTTAMAARTRHRRPSTTINSINTINNSINTIITTTIGRRIPRTPP
mmetsp:Transcript_13509/g.29568  ORF Transcript_13509/g.29568 Transcript_13509/m.29568 type:complete len:84 (-) Transcript_13509:637-888(-)